MLGLEAERLFEALARGVEVAQLALDRAELHDRLDVVRRELDDPLQLALRDRPVLASTCCLGELVVRQHQMRRSRIVGELLQRCISARVVYVVQRERRREAYTQ